MSKKKKKIDKAKKKEKRDQSVAGQRRKRYVKYGQAPEKPGVISISEGRNVSDASLNETLNAVVSGAGKGQGRSMAKSARQKAREDANLPPHILEKRRAREARKEVEGGEERGYQEVIAVVEREIEISVDLEYDAKAYLFRKR